MKRFDTLSDRILVLVILVVCVGLLVLTIYPFWDLLVLSISPREEALSMGLRLYTLRPTFGAYLRVFTSPNIGTAFMNSLIRTVSGTVLSVFLVALTAYPLSKKGFPLRGAGTVILLFTMMFSGGLIPSYLLMKALHLLDTRWVLILPGAVSAYNVIIMRNFLYSIPDSLEESARIDGATDFTVFLRIVLPLSTPALATIALWVAVGHWNAFFDALVYTTKPKLIVLQVILRRLLLESQLDTLMPPTMDLGQIIKPTEETLKAAIIMVATLPIVMVYPFVQKYFTKGIMLGAVKG